MRELWSNGPQNTVSEGRPPGVKDGGDRQCCKKEVETQSKFSPWAAAHKSRINNLEYLLRREYYERRKET